MMKAKDMKIGDWTPVEEDGTFMIKVSKETFYSSENQDTIMIMSELIKLRVTLRLDRAFDKILEGTER